MLSIRFGGISSVIPILSCSFALANSAIAKHLA